MKTAKFLVTLALVTALTAFTFSTAFADPPLGIQSCSWNPPVSSNDPMCDWHACIDLGGGGTSCSPYTLKYYRNYDLLATNANITRAIIVVHGRRDNRVTIDDRPYNYYEHIFDAAVDRGLVHETLIIAPFFDRATKCPVGTDNQCVQGASSVDNPWCGGNAGSDGRLCWGGTDEDDYPAGGNANNDDAFRTASFRLLDSMVETLAYLKGEGTFPNLDTIVVTGQSAGGQFALRYAMAGSAEPEGITMRYVACNPGGVTYLNGFRPTQEAKEAFPNIGYEWDCDNDGTNEQYMPPGLTGILADMDDWANYPSLFEIPHWEDQNSHWGDCITDGRYEKWPWGIADVSTTNDYMATNVVTADEVRARYLKRNVVILSSIDDNLYVAADNCGAPDVASEFNCMHALQGHARVERNALFFKYTCLGYGCSNHAFDTVCRDDNADGHCDYFVQSDIYIPCIRSNPPDPCELRLMHGRGIYRTDVARDAVFFGLKPTPVETQWGKTLGGLGSEKAVAVELTPDGGYIVLGETNSYGAGGKDFWVVKLNEEGTVLWQKTYGGEGDDIPADITALPEGGYLLAGRTNSYANGTSDAWVVRIDENGALEWSNSYGGDSADVAVAVALSVDGNYVVAGNTSEREDIYDPGDTDGWLMKLSPNGYIYWRKIFDGSTMDSLSSIHETWDGGYILAGNTQVRNGDFWVLKLDPDGNVQREKVYGMNELGLPDGNENIEFAPHVALTHDGGYILAGASYPLPAGAGTIWVVRLADDFSVTWQKMFSAGGHCDVSSIQPTTDGGFILSGFQKDPGVWPPYDRLLMKLDSDGDSQWGSGYGVSGADRIFSIRQTRDGGYVAVGVTESLSFSEQDLWVLKLDENGAIPDCPAVQTSSYSADEGPAEGPGDFTSSVSESTPLSITWTELVMVTDPITAQVFEGDGCSRVVLTDVIDLPRTGQTTPYYTGDDGHIQAGVPWPGPLRFYDNGDGSITDNLTGLVWLKDGNCLGGNLLWKSGLDAVAQFNANPADFSCIDYDTENAKNDWRMPNINELESLVNAQVGDNAAWLNGDGFENVLPDSYWSSTAYAGHGQMKWCVSMAKGETSNEYQTSVRRVWVVRGGQKDYWEPYYPANVWKTGQTFSYYPGDDGEFEMGVFWPSPRFEDNGDGTVTDNLTGLVWLQDTLCFEPPTHTGITGWENALHTVADFNDNPGAYTCAGYDIGNHEKGWRLPNNKELLSLTDWTKWRTSLPAGHPFLNVDTSALYWTSTTYPSNTGPRAWTSYIMGKGGLGEMLKEHGQPTLWPVRGGVKCQGDCDRDGDVDGSDLVGFLLDFAADNPEGACGADFNRDGHVDGQDLARVAASLGRTNCLGQ